MDQGEFDVSTIALVAAQKVNDERWSAGQLLALTRAFDRVLLAVERDELAKLVGADGPAGG